MAKYGTTKMLEEDRDLNKSNMEEAENNSNYNLIIKLEIFIKFRTAI